MHLQRALDYCLFGLDPSLYKVYLGQLLVHTVDVNQHLAVLQMILGRLMAANLRLDVKRSIFLCSSITFLDMGVSKAGIAIRPEKIERIKHFPQPTTRNELQTFLCLASQYRRYVNDYPDLAQPLVKMENRSEFHINFTEKERWAFETLKMCFLNANPIPLRPVRLNANYANHPVICCSH